MEHGKIVETPQMGTGGTYQVQQITTTFILFCTLFSSSAIVYSANFGNGYFGTTAYLLQEVMQMVMEVYLNMMYHLDFTALNTKNINTYG